MFAFKNKKYNTHLVSEKENIVKYRKSYTNLMYEFIKTYYIKILYALTKKLPLNM